MNKFGKTNWLLIVILVVAVIGAIYLFSNGTLEKQRAEPIEFGENTSESGGLKLELITEDGDRGFMGDEFYKIDSGAFSIIRGATAVSCTTNADCTSRCPAGDTFCQSYITCYDTKCSYKEIAAIAWHTEVINTGEAELEVTFDSATTNPASTAFNTAYSPIIGIARKLKSGENTDFTSGDMPLSSYETGAPTIFTIGAHAVNQYTSVRIPTTGSQTSGVTLTIYPDPTTQGFTISLGGLGGL